MRAELIELLPEDVARVWDEFAPGIERSLDGVTTYEVMNNILQALLAGYLRMYALGVAAEDKREVIAVVVVGVNDNELLGLRTLWIYAISGKRFDLSAWQQGLHKLKLVAERLGCHQIQTVVRRKRMIKILEALGTDMSVRSVTWRID